MCLLYFYINYGTGSKPLPPHGLHDANLLSVNHPPLSAPYFFMASIPYSLHVGIYLHDAGNNGEMLYL